METSNAAPILIGGKDRKTELAKAAEYAVKKFTKNEIPSNVFRRDLYAENRY